MPHIFEIPSISNGKPSISTGNLAFRSKYLVFQIRNFEILGFSHLEFQILDISIEIPGTSKAWNFD